MYYYSPVELNYSDSYPCRRQRITTGLFFYLDSIQTQSWTQKPEEDSSQSNASLANSVAGNKVITPLPIPIDALSTPSLSLHALIDSAIWSLMILLIEILLVSVRNVQRPSNSPAGRWLKISRSHPTLSRTASFLNSRRRKSSLLWLLYLLGFPLSLVNLGWWGTLSAMTTCLMLLVGSVMGAYTT